MREIQLEIEEEVNRTAALNIARQKVALELAERLRELKNSNSQATQAGLSSYQFKLYFFAAVPGLDYQ